LSQFLSITVWKWEVKFNVFVTCFYTVSIWQLLCHNNALVPVWLRAMTQDCLGHDCFYPYPLQVIIHCCPIFLCYTVWDTRRIAFKVNLMHCLCLLVLLHHHFLLFNDVAFVTLLALKLYNLIDFVNVLAPKDDFSQYALRLWEPWMSPKVVGQEHER
jgi:hypothetical protein